MDTKTGNQNEKGKEFGFPIFSDSVSVKKLLHPKLEGYFEYEMTRITFQSELDLKFYKAIEKNDTNELEQILKNGHSPDRLFRKDTIRLITSDRIAMVDFEKFKSDVKAHENIKDTNHKINIVEKIQDTKSLMSLSFEKKSYDIVDILVKHGTNLAVKDETIRLLSDYKERFEGSPSSTSRGDYLNVITSEKSYNPIVGTLVEKNDMSAIKLLVENLKAQIDFNSPRIQKKEVLTVDDLTVDQIGQNQKLKSSISKRPLEVAVENNNMEMANYLKDNGADIKLMSLDSRKAFRKLEREYEMNGSKHSLDNFAKNMAKESGNKERSI
jgi:ankyrin repeat protein